MISWPTIQAFLVLTLLASESVASHTNGLRRKHAGSGKHIAKRQSCKPKHKSFTITASTTKTTASSTHTTTTTPEKPKSTPKNDDDNNDSKSSDNDNKGNSNNNSNNNSNSNSGSNSHIKSVQAAAGFTPNGNKAGTSSGNAMSQIQSHIGWWYDWTPNPSWKGNVMPVPMLWGGGGADSTDSSRLAAFSKISQAPQYMLGFEEPDCPSGGGSAGMSVDDGVKLWEEKIAPFKAKGTKLGSPSMCKQVAETWLKEFSNKIKTDWDFTAVHINKNNMDGVRADIEHYAQYGKPLWITEFACVDDVNGFTPCTDQGQINSFINQIVPLFEGDGRVAAYAYSNGMGLGNVWPMTNSNGDLTESGRTYINAISKYH
ncbi:Glyco-hydro-cc domain-containing protein [Favolaschia claudopus]|uniref:Glyco-hydro-cc domain-containing protein n=1 Tax=Favolaschia claudopus TaxID=2862362 RepID=A0AAW0C2K5_9AGAR